MKARELAEKYGYELGCGDSSCTFGSKGGQHTNGGCRCPTSRRPLTINTTQGELDDLLLHARTLRALLVDIAKRTP